MPQHQHKYTSHRYFYQIHHDTIFYKNQQIKLRISMLNHQSSQSTNILVMNMFKTSINERQNLDCRLYLSVWLLSTHQYQVFILLIIEQLLMPTHPIDLIFLNSIININLLIKSKILFSNQFKHIQLLHLPKDRKTHHLWAHMLQMILKNYFVK